MRRVLWSLSLLGMLHAQQPVLLTLTEGDGAIHAAGLTSFPQLNPLGTTPVPGLYRNQLLAMGDTVVLVSSGDDALYRLVVDTSLHQQLQFQVVDTLHLPTGSNPYAAVSLGSQLAVSLFLSDQIALVNPATGTVGLHNTGKAPEGVALWGDNLLVAATAYDVATYSYGQGMLYFHQISAGLQAVDSLPVCINPQKVFVDSTAGVATLLCTGDYGSTEGALVRVDLSTHQVLDTLPLTGYPTAVGFHNGMAYVGGYDASFANVVYRVDTTTGQSTSLPALVSLIDLEAPGGDTLLILEGGAAWSDPAHVVVYDAAADTVMQRLTVGPGAMDLLRVQLPVQIMESTLRNRRILFRLASQRALILNLPARTPWRLEIFSLTGRQIQTHHGQGPSTLRPRLPMGVYLYRLHTPGTQEQGRFLWLSR